MKNTNPSQAEMILAYMSKGNPLTSLSALHIFGCFRLAARIYELRKEGYEIQERKVERNGKHYAEYQLAA